MLLLNQFVPSGKTPDPSVFCTKVELFLKIHGLEYEGRPGNPMKAPKSKLPTIVDGSRVVCDSEAIIRYLSEKHSIVSDRLLTDDQKVLSFMIRKTLEEYMYFIILYTRWIDDEGFKSIPGVVFKNMPSLARLIVPKIVRPQVRKQLYQQGIARHESYDVSARGREVLENLSHYVGKHRYIFGNEPSLIDCVVFPVLWGVLHYPSDNELRRTAQRFPAFSAYVDNILATYYR